MALIKCSECGKEISDKAKSCVHCGCPVSMSYPKLIRCPDCGKEISAKATACVHCGCPIPSSTAKPANNQDVQKLFDDIFSSSAPELSVNFNAVLSGGDNGSTRQSIFVKEIGSNVTFNAPNNIQVGQSIRVRLEGEKYTYIRFHVTGITRATSPASTTTNSPTANQNAAAAAIETLKKYKPNWVIAFINSRRFYTLMLIYVGAMIAQLGSGGGLYMVAVTAVGLGPVFLPMLIARIFYPIHHLKKYIRKNKIEDAIKNDTGLMRVAINTYNVLPGKATLRYIRKLNPAAAEKLVQMRAELKKKK